MPEEAHCVRLYLAVTRAEKTLLPPRRVGETASSAGVKLSNATRRFVESVTARWLLLEAYEPLNALQFCLHEDS
jgi:hypothetical protein